MRQKLVLAMDFLEFSKRISKIKKLPLPGTDSHYKMAPEVRIKALEKFFERPLDVKRAGVMALFYPDTQYKPHFLLIKRNTYPGVHSDQIGFPGGQVEDADYSLKQTALRETWEEVGVPPDNIRVIRKLTKLYIPPSNFEVRPYIGMLEHTISFTPDPGEVSGILEVPVFDLLDPANEIEVVKTTSYANELKVPAFDLQGHTVWGATAMMLSEIRELLKKVV